MHKCPQCGAIIGPNTPRLAADMIIYDKAQGIVLVRRRYLPPGWALPGGFVEYGEKVEDAARREAWEETGLEVRQGGLVGVYSDPARDKRGHTASVVFWGQANNPEGVRGGDDAAEARFFALDALPEPLAFDHRQIISDFIALLKSQGI